MPLTPARRATNKAVSRQGGGLAGRFSPRRLDSYQSLQRRMVEEELRDPNLDPEIEALLPAWAIRKRRQLGIEPVDDRTPEQKAYSWVYEFIAKRPDDVTLEMLDELECQQIAHFIEDDFGFPADVALSMVLKAVEVQKVHAHNAVLSDRSTRKPGGPVPVPLFKVGEKVLVGKKVYTVKEVGPNPAEHKSRLYVMMEGVMTHIYEDGIEKLPAAAPPASDRARQLKLAQARIKMLALALAAKGGSGLAGGFRKWPKSYKTFAKQTEGFVSTSVREREAQAIRRSQLANAEYEAEQLGRDAFAHSLLAVPASDPDLRQRMEVWSLQVGEGTAVMQAWLKGWHDAKATSEAPAADRARKLKLAQARIKILALALAAKARNEPAPLALPPAPAVEALVAHEPKFALFQRVSSWAGTGKVMGIGPPATEPGFYRQYTVDIEGGRRQFLNENSLFDAGDDSARPPAGTAAAGDAAARELTSDYPFFYAGDRVISTNAGRITGVVVSRHENGHTDPREFEYRVRVEKISGSEPGLTINSVRGYAGKWLQAQPAAWYDDPAERERLIAAEKAATKRRNNLTTAEYLTEIRAAEQAAVAPASPAVVVPGPTTSAGGVVEAASLDYALSAEPGDPWEIPQAWGLRLPANEFAFLREVNDNQRNAHFTGAHRMQLGKLAAKHNLTQMHLQRELTELSTVHLARTLLLPLRRFPSAPFGPFLERLVMLYQNQYSLADLKTTTTLINQQYSTPAPLAALLGEWICRKYPTLGIDYHGFIDKPTFPRVLEPTAGNGLLTVRFDPSIIHANELEETRFKHLALQGFGQLTNRDATEPLARWQGEGGQRIKAVIANPPFGSTGKKAFLHRNGVTDYPLTGWEHVIAAQALKDLADDGRAAIIIGGHHQYDRYGKLVGRDYVFFNYLYSHYKVVDVLHLDSHKLYARQGATWPIRVILIDGVHPDPAAPAPVNRALLPNTVYDSYEQLARVLGLV